MVTFSEIAVYALGWMLFVVAQAHNSVESSANGLHGSVGYMKWLKYQAANIATRAFFSAIFFTQILQYITLKIHDAGLPMEATAIAGTAGYAANALLYQFFGFRFFGLMPWLRVEVQELAPPEEKKS